MKEEIRKKRERMKAKFLEIERNVNTKGMSNAERNKALLDAVTSKEEVNEENDLQEKERRAKGQIKNRHFKCECGMPVELSGEISLDENITKCSKCMDKIA